MKRDYKKLSEKFTEILNSFSAEDIEKWISEEYERENTIPTRVVFYGSEKMKGERVGSIILNAPNTGIVSAGENNYALAA